MRPYLEKNPSAKRAGEVTQGEGPEFKPQYCKKKKRPRGLRDKSIFKAHTVTTMIPESSFL
jgi:hypothetical protein